MENISGIMHNITHLVAEVVVGTPWCKSCQARPRLLLYSCFYILSKCGPNYDIHEISWSRVVKYTYGPLKSLCTCNCVSDNDSRALLVMNTCLSWKAAFLAFPNWYYRHWGTHEGLKATITRSLGYQSRWIHLVNIIPIWRVEMRSCDILNVDLYCIFSQWNQQRCFTRPSPSALIVIGWLLQQISISEVSIWPSWFSLLFSWTASCKMIKLEELTNISLSLSWWRWASKPFGFCHRHYRFTPTKPLRWP